jgi:riboflavin kinase / FMN adenylyltransferase
VQIIRGYQALGEDLGPVVMTIGTYDGLHLGHKAIIQRVVTHARREGAKALVYSFYPPPWRLLGRAEHPWLILDFADKVRLLEDMGVDVLLTEVFTPELQRLTHIQFAEEVLNQRLAPREIHVGYDFHFGQGRLGDWTYLRDTLSSSGVTIRPHGAVRLDGQIIGCRRIRAQVAEGRVDQAAALLGRHHVVRGTVTTGDRRGRTIGFPTANVKAATELVPRDGVYAVTFQVEGSTEVRRGIANVGVRPTFGGDDQAAIEVHLFDFDGDVYGKEVLVSFVWRVRDEQKFAGIEALVAQIKADVETVRGRVPWPQPSRGTLTWDPKPA